MFIDPPWTYARSNMFIDQPAGSTGTLNGNVKAAIVMQKSGLSYPKSVARLRRSHDFVRDAIGEDVEARLKELLKVG